ncbi:hypothetical protein RQ359_001909 [Sulfuracidifex metallicus DSM 6482 = JCM 9184]|nr:hypothetical protein RQ359_001909 [Sulfuracidifex metallicus DSM 6482 = JCM 9184]
MSWELLLHLAVIAIAYGTLLIALYLNGHIGTKWGIPYPICGETNVRNEGWQQLPVI